MKHLLIYGLLMSINCSLTSMQTIDLSKKTIDDLYTIMEIANKKKQLLLCNKNLSLYKECIAHILPLKLCKQIDMTYALINNEKTKEAYKKHNIGTTSYYYSVKTPTLTISNDGHYFTHNVAFKDYSSEFQFINTELIGTNNNPQIHEFYSNYNEPIYFIPNNEHCIIKDLHGTYFYNIINNTKQLLHPEEEGCKTIITSDNNQHFLIKTSQHRSSAPKYTLWTLDEQNMPQITPVKKHIFQYAFSSGTTLFHPNNKQLIYSMVSSLGLYTIETAEDTIITPKSDKTVNSYIHRLTLSSDNKKVLALTYGYKENHSEYSYILFNIENLDNVTSVTIPPQLCHTYHQLPMLYIPQKNIFTRITNHGVTLELLDEKAQLITSHATTNYAYITVLTVDNTGNYLTAGYSDGTIMIWNLFSSDPKDFEKIFVASKDTIKSLTFNENQLLLSQSESGRFRGTGNLIYTSGTAILWDMYGNQVINFGDNVVTSIMSPNGKTIIIISAELKLHNISCSLGQRYLTLTAYCNKNQTLQYMKNNELTLSQLYQLTAQSNDS